MGSGGTFGLKTSMAALVAALLFICASAEAGEELRIDGGGFRLGNRVRASAWTPITARVENKGAAGTTVTYRLEYEVKNSAGRKVSYSRSVWAPARTTRELTLNIFLDMDQDTLLGFFRNKEGRENVKTWQRSFADGSRLDYTSISSAQSFNIDTYLMKGTLNGNVVTHDLIYANVVHPNSLNIACVDAFSSESPAGITYKRNNREYIYGEVEGDLRQTSFVSDTTGFSNDNIPPMEMLGGKYIQRGSVNAGVLPRIWASYQGMDVLVLGGLRNESEGLPGLDPFQAQSLMEWVVSGGRLVVMPSNEGASFNTPFFDKLLPVRLLGDRNSHRLDALEKRYGGSIPYCTEYPFRRAEALPGEGEALVTDANGHVLLARRQVGRGEVWFSAVKGHVFGKWRQNIGIFTSMLHQENGPVPGLEPNLAPEVTSLMRQVVGISAPNRAFVVALLIFYCAAVVGVLVYARMRGRGELGWPALIVLAAICCLLALLQGRLARSKTGFVQGEIGVTVLGNKQGRASAHSFVSVFSPAALQTTGIFTNPTTLATAYSGGKEAQRSSMGISSLNVDEADNFLLRGMTVNPGELFTCRAMTLSEYGQGVELRFGYGPKGYVGSVANHTGDTLRDCLVMVGRRMIKVGDLSDGQARDLADCELSDRLEQVDRMSSQSFSTSQDDQTRARVLALARRLPNRPGSLQIQEAEWPVTFYGWANKPQALFRLEGESNPSQRALSLVALPAERVDAEKGKEIFVPAGSCGLALFGNQARRAYGAKKTLNFANARAMQADSKGEDSSYGGLGSQQQDADPEAGFRPPMWLSDSGPVSFTVGFLPPQGLETLEVQSAKLLFDIELREMTARISIQNQGANKFEALDMKGGKELEIPNIAQYLGKNGELPVVRVSINMSTVGGSQMRWQIKALDLELRGKLGERKIARPAAQPQAQDNAEPEPAAKPAPVAKPAAPAAKPAAAVQPKPAAPAAAKPAASATRK